jgi:pimeloyl-[acyl-carrier protein] methyl ester esterase
MVARKTRAPGTARAGATDVVNIAVPGGTIAVECAGAGTPIVLLHGWTLDRRMWAPQIEALAGRFRLIAIDRRGFGRSTAPPGLAAESGDILTVLTRLGIDRAVILGMSQGGRIALRFALTHPGRVAGLVLQGAPLDGFAPEPGGDDAIPYDDYAALVRAGRLDEMKARWRHHPLMHAGTPSGQFLRDEALAGYDGRDLVDPGPDAVAPIAGLLDTIDAPALVVTGAQDAPWRQLVSDALAYGLPNGARTRIAGAGHLCNLTHAGAFNRRVASFVAGLESGRRT